MEILSNYPILNWYKGGILFLMSGEILERLKKTKVIPVAVLSNVNDAIRLIEIFLKYSFDLIEITLRTREALDIIYQLKRKFPDVTLGAGSILTENELMLAAENGADFLVSPVLDTSIIKRANRENFFYIPGVSTVSELFLSLNFCDVVKVFPVAVMGGVSYLKSISSPLKSLDFSLIPTGGINGENFVDYLRLERVSACGMSYICDPKLINLGEWGQIESRVKEVSMKLLDLR